MLHEIDAAVGDALRPAQGVAASTRHKTVAAVAGHLRAAAHRPPRLGARRGGVRWLARPDSGLRAAGYGFEGHEGCINEIHNDAIRRYGITPHHRGAFDAAIYRQLGT